MVLLGAVDLAEKGLDRFDSYAGVLVSWDVMRGAVVVSKRVPLSLHGVSLT